MTPQEWFERKSAGHARLELMSVIREPGIEIFQAGPGLPVSPFPLDNQFHSVLMFMEQPNMNGRPVKAVLIMGQGQMSTIAYTPQMTIIPADVMIFSETERVILPYYSPNVIDGEVEITIPAKAAAAPVVPEDERTKLVNFLKQSGIPDVPPEMSITQLRMWAARRGYKG